ncbi:MAG: hypothetical protein ACXAAH_16015 [Promethearchaeota archaeon]|jgi:hypothetical protein
MILRKIKKVKNNHFIKRNLSALIIIILFSAVISNVFFTNYSYSENHPFNNNKDKPRMSWFWATLDLTNPGEVNNSLFTHFSSISVRGRLYNKISGENKTGINVAIEVDDAIDMRYTDVTNVNGQFDINYIIDEFLDVYTIHKLEVVVTDTEPGGPGSEIEYPHYYTINVNATSFFDITSSDDPSVAKLTEEDFNIVGSLKYDNGQGIPFGNVNYYWFDGPTIISQGFFFTDNSGSLINLQVPITLASYLTLKLNYTNNPFVGYSETSIFNIKVFSDANFGLNIDYVTTEGDTYSLTGSLSSSTDPLIKIGNRDVDVIFNGTTVDTTTTAADGTFSSSFLIPSQNGTATIQVDLDNSAGKLLSSTPQFITVENRPPSTQRPIEMPPFLIFSLIFFPILIGIIVGLAIYGFFFYKKQEEESRVVAIPLESILLQKTRRRIKSSCYSFGVKNFKP